MTVPALFLIWLGLGIAGAIATSRWAKRLWARKKELSFAMAAVALISVSAAMLASLGIVVGVIRAVGALGGETVDPSQKARVLAEAIAAAMNCTAFGIVVWLPSLAVLLFAMKKRANRPG